MKLTFLAVLGLCLSVPIGRAAEPLPVVPASELTAVEQADEERVAATVAVDRARLDDVLSDALSYAHSNGARDTKASLIDGLVGRRMVYLGFDYRERVFQPIAPGVVLMRGRVIAQIRAGEQSLPLDLSYLAVWRSEQGRWRMVAWQSCRNPVRE